MIRLAYLSTSIIDEEKREKALLNIFESSKKWNPTLGITGVLIHGAGKFLQVLEGPDLNVLRKFFEISEDTRHSDCQILLVSVAAELAFPNWSMAVFEAEPLEFQRISELLSHKRESVDAKAFAELVKHFVKMVHA